MFKTTRLTIILALVGVFIASVPMVAAAQPSAYECLENPQLEGCPSSESTGDQEQPPVEEEIESQEDASSSSLVWNIIKLIFALIFVVALIYGLLKFFNQKNKLFNRNKTMENLGGMNLGPNRSIQAVRIGGQVFILGVGESVEMIAEITDESTKNTLMQQDEQTQGSTPFAMDKWIGKWKQKNDQPKSSDSSIQFQQLFENQLNDMKKKRKQAVDEDRRDQDHE
ncbi:flagellar biosynthetic protein FliO [Halobacillus litoralis]|nr:flagellar biosynthetic protein FliO [Halobacillus litoralis]